ncbi:UNVERIFIED_CONTAM: hypothetical protein Sradi_4360200 [Sesamum radiatum]|uniref:Uncharacterized protein n=1 Tax=Sesamum radiatum TaxID=300843 RepID=A0AAW2NNG5_SESRA
MSFWVSNGSGPGAVHLRLQCSLHAFYHRGRLVTLMGNPSMTLQFAFCSAVSLSRHQFR